MTHDEKIEVIQAQKNGKSVQFRTKPKFLYASYLEVAAEDWSDRPVKHEFDFVCHDYRVKPEPPKPREFDLGICRLHGHSWVVAERPNSRVLAECDNCQVIHVREVLE